MSYDENNIAIFAYGSLLSDPGENLGPRIIGRLPRPSPWPIEYARRAKVRGDGPTLVIHHSGATVQGKVLVLDALVEAIDDVEEWLWEREGRPPHTGIKRMAWEGFKIVLYCELEANLGEVALTGELLAGFAIDSVRKNPTRNAIRYLAQNIEKGIITPLTYAYRDAILHATGARDLVQAEEYLLRAIGYAGLATPQPK